MSALSEIPRFGATVLCLEDGLSAFSASQEVFRSKTYEVVAATSVPAAVDALRAIPRINVAVLASGNIAPKTQFIIAAEMEAARPGLPKIIVARHRVFPPNFLSLTYVDSLELLNLEVRRLVACSRAQLRETECQSRSLRAESQHVRERARQLRKQLTEDWKRFGN